MSAETVTCRQCRGAGFTGLGIAYEKRERCNGTGRVNAVPPADAKPTVTVIAPGKREMG